MAASRRHNLKIIFDNSTIIPFKASPCGYTCFYCDAKLSWSYETFLKHYQSHGTETEVGAQLTRHQSVGVRVDVSNIICKICNESFISIEDIISHLSSNHDLNYDRNVSTNLWAHRLRDYACTYCASKFDTFHKLAHHINSDHPRFSCNECGLKFKKYSIYLRHVTKHRHDELFSCDNCPTAYYSVTELDKHKADCHAASQKYVEIKLETMSLQNKSSSFSDKSKRKLRNKDVKNKGLKSLKKLLSCDKCPIAYYSRSELEKHKADTHTDSQDYIDIKLEHVATKTTQEIEKCDTQGGVKKSTSDTRKVKAARKKRDVLLPPRKSSVKRRVNMSCILKMSTGIPFRFDGGFLCGYCSKSFDNSEALKQHTVLEHDPNDFFKKFEAGEYDLIRYKWKLDISNLSCRICKEAVADINTLIDHIISVHNAEYDQSVEHGFQAFKLVQDKFPCPFCGDPFRYFTTLVRHISRKHKEKNEICAFCGKCFHAPVALENHVRRHHEQRILECVRCNETFDNISKYDMHQAVKHGVNTHKCDSCGEIFPTLYLKRRHMFTHGIGYKCSHCELMFVKYDIMMTHIRRVHLNEKELQCSMCSRIFFSKVGLKLHMPTHSGERNFRCKFCDATYMRPDNLRRHNKKVHGI